MNPQQAQDPLAQLRDIHLPNDVGWWPPAPGWWLLALFLLAALAVLGRHGWRLWQRNAYRRSGERELDQLYAAWQESGDNRLFLQQANALLKRVALVSFPGTDVAAMHGARWTGFLDRQWRDESRKVFSGGPLETGPYAPHTEGISEGIDVAAVHRDSLRWLREHRGEA
jgi:hypothetical protein